VALSPDGTRLAAGTPAGEVVVYDAASGAVLGRCSAEQRHDGEVRSLAYRPNGKQLASASADGTVRLWDVRGSIPTVTATLRGHAGFVSQVVYLTGGELLASAGEDGGARIWDVNGRRVAAPDLHHYLAAPWYRFDPVTQEARWAGGAGAANVPEGSLLDLHLKKADTSDLLAKAKVPAPTGARKRAVAKEEKNYQNEEGIELLWVKPGTFKMGSPKDEEGRFHYETQHKVTLTQGYWLAKTELTQAQWKAVTGNNPSTYASSGLTAPVENISWEEAMEYCRRLTDLERARRAIPPGWEYTLPTEAQWEFACRAGTETAYSFGNDPADLHKYGNYNEKTGNFPNADMAHDDGKEFSATVGSYPANKFGFHDMHGNVFEWCRDAMDPHPLTADYGAADTTDPLGAIGSLRIYRGGGFNYTAHICRSAYRYAYPPSNRSLNLGFRPALSPHMNRNSQNGTAMKPE
jgi:formylglycine-generating enzyme required for sulfatase activity